MFADHLAEMIETGRPNRAWLRYKRMEVYVRVGKRIIDGKQTDCVQLANIQTPPKHQRKGTFDQLLKEIRAVTKMPIYVEQLLNRDFYEALLRRGFTPAKEYEGMVLDLVLVSDP